MSNKNQILIVDDEKNFAVVLRIFLEKAGYRVETVASVEAATEALRQHNYQLVLLDLRLPDGSGLDVLKRITETKKETVTIVMTGFASLESARSALKLKVYDYLLKPFNDMEHDLLRVVRRALEYQELKSNNRQLLEQLKRYYRQNEKERERARKVQQSLLPKELRLSRDYVAQGKNLFAPLGGGGFYNLRQLRDGRSAFYLGDVGGTGMPAALLMATVTSVMEGLIQTSESPAEIIRMISKIMNRHLQAGFKNFIAVTLFILEPHQRKLTWSSAGGTPSILLRSGRKREILEGAGPFLGNLKSSSYQNQEVTLDIGDRLVLYNQALLEASNGEQEPFGRERLCAVLPGPWEHLGDRVFESWQEFVADPPREHDIMFFALEKRS